MVDLALVHRFYGSFGTGREEEESKNLLQKLFIGLRIVKPTRLPFSVIQYRLTPTGVDVFSFTHPQDPLMMNLPESEVLNHLDVRDLELLRTVAPTFLHLIDKGPSNLRRTIRYYETGYSNIHEPELQFVVWMMGIEALFSNGDEPSRPEQIKQRIIDTIGQETDIYKDFKNRDLYAPDPLRVSEVLDSMFEMRNRLVHGSWVPADWFHKTIRQSISSQSLTLADILREAASFILRNGLLRTVLAEQDRA